VTFREPGKPQNGWEKTEVPADGQDLEEERRRPPAGG
jgi:hypothetical protein